MTLNVPILSILIGEGGSGGALALAVADRVWMLEHAIYSVISPEGCASILWKDAGKAPEAAQNLRITAEDALEFEVIEEIISERDLGKASFYDALREKIQKELDTLCAMEKEDLKEARYLRFRRIGTKNLEGEQ